MIEERVDSGTDAERQSVYRLRYVDDLILRDRDTTGNGTLDERLYALQDPHWSVTAVVDEMGAVQERYAYDPYGNARFFNASFTGLSGSACDWNVRYSGYRRDASSDLYAIRVRHLHPHLGWLQRDPWSYRDSMNMYAVVAQRPTGFVDPWGLAGIRTDMFNELAGASGIPTPYPDSSEQNLQQGMAVLDGIVAGAGAIPASVAQGSLNILQAGYNSALTSAVSPTTSAAAALAGVPNPYDLSDTALAVDFSIGVFLDEDPALKDLGGNVGLAGIGLGLGALAAMGGAAGSIDDVMKGVGNWLRGKPRCKLPPNGGEGYRVMSPEEFQDASQGVWSDGALVVDDPVESGKKWFWGSETEAQNWLDFIRENGEDGLVAVVQTKRPLTQYPQFPHPPQGTAIHIPIKDLGSAIWRGR